MHSHRILSTVTMLGLLVVGCGVAGSDPDSTTEASPEPISVPTDPDTTTEASPEPISVPTDPDTAIVSIGFNYSAQPELTIGGDGWVYFPTDTEAPTGLGLVNPGPVLRIGANSDAQPVSRRRLTAEGIAIVIGLANELDLLEEPDEYDDISDYISDSGDTLVKFTIDDGIFDHRAYALGSAEPETGNRERLARFVMQLRDLEELVGSDNIGPVEQYRSQRHVLIIDGFYRLTDDNNRTWPAALDFEQGCVTLPFELFPNGPAGAWIANTASGQVPYNVVPDLPGDICT